MDLITSQKAFVNTQPRDDDLQGPGARRARRRRTSSQTTLPADQRAGMLTNAGFITTRARSTGVGVVPARPRRQGAVPLPRDAGAARDQPPPADAVKAQAARSRTQTAQEQVAYPPADGALQQLPPVVRSLRPRARLVRRRRPLPDDGRPRQADRRAHDAAGRRSAAQTVQQRRRARGRAVEERPRSRTAWRRPMLQYALLDATVELPAARSRSRRAARRPTSPTRCGTAAGSRSPTSIKAVAHVARVRHAPAGPVAQRTPHDRSPSEVSENDLVSVQAASVPDRDERRRRAQDHAAQHGSGGADDEVAGAAAGHALAGRHRRGLGRRALEADVRQRRRVARACSRSPTTASAPT